MIEDKIDNPTEKVTRPIKYTQKEVKELIKTCIQQPPEVDYQNGMKLLDKRYGGSHRIRASN